MQINPIQNSSKRRHAKEHEVVKPPPFQHVFSKVKTNKRDTLSHQYSMETSTCVAIKTTFFDNFLRGSFDQYLTERDKKPFVSVSLRHIRVNFLRAFVEKNSSTILRHVLLLQASLGHLESMFLSLKIFRARCR